MSIAASSDEEKMHKKSFHRRHDSGELDVFEAAGYFSGYNEQALGQHQHHHHQQLQGGSGTTASFPQKFTTREDRQSWRGGRMSLDIPIRNALNNPSSAQLHGVVDKQITKDHHKKLYKQPSSPGGRLASFLNSLFNQTANSKKKKSSSSSKSITSTQSMKDHHHHHHHHHEDQESSPGGSGGRRKRRSSISHFRISTSTTTDSKSLYSSSSSGFRSPPPATKSYKDLRSYSDHKQVAPTTTSLSKIDHNNNNNNGHHHLHHVKSSIVSLHNEILLDDNKFSNGLVSEKNRKLGNEKSNKEGFWADRYPSEEKEFRMFTNDQTMDDGDDGAESDSSSDLFELQNYDLGCCYSTGNLPVYETTNMESINNIKRGAPISNAIIL